VVVVSPSLLVSDISVLMLVLVVDDEVEQDEELSQRLVLVVAEEEEIEEEEEEGGRGGCKAATTTSISAFVKASPPFKALTRFFSFLRSRFLSLGAVSSSCSPPSSGAVVEDAFLPKERVERVGDALLLLLLFLLGSIPLSRCSCLYSRRRRAIWRWRCSWAALLRRQVSQLCA
jgi:hypothetical protein